MLGMPHPNPVGTVAPADVEEVPPPAEVPTVQQQLLTVNDVCRELGITRSTWDKWRAKRIGPPVVCLPNRSLRVRAGDLTAWIEGCLR